MSMGVERNVFKKSGLLFFVLFAIFILTGCFVDSRIAYLGSLNNELKIDDLAPIISPTTVTISANKSISYSTAGGTPPYSYALVQGSGSINATTGAYTAGASTGSAIVEVTDTTGKKSQSTVTINPLPSLVSNQLDLFVNSGFGLDFLLPTPNGGVPSFSYTIQSGTGSVVGSTYLPPSTAGTAVVKISDQFNDSVSLNIKVRSFDPKFTSLPAVSVSAIPSLVDAVQIGTEIYGVFYVSTSPSSRQFLEGYKPTTLYMYKTSDLGTTWQYISAYRIRAEAAVSAVKLFREGGRLLLIGSTARVGLPNDRDSFIAESTDLGLNWTVKDWFAITSDPDFVRTAYADAVIAADGKLVLVGAASTSVDSRLKTFIRKCDMSSWSCSVLHTFDTTDSFARNNISAIKRTSNGDLYIAQLYGTNISDTTTYVKKSTDSGATWSTLYSLSTTSTKISHFEISSNGQILILAGSIGASTPYTRVSTDAGATFTTIGGANACPGWEVTRVIINDTTGDALSFCYNYSGSYTGYLRKLASGGTTWTALQTIANSYVAYFFKSATGPILTSVFGNAANTMYTTSNFGTSFSAAASPTQSFPPDAELMDIVQSGASTFYSVGYLATTTGAQRRANIYNSTDSGVTWNTVTTLADTGSVFTAIGISPTTNTLIASGRETLNKWVAYRSINGVAWSNVDTQTIASGSSITPKKILASATGVFYSIGHYTDSTFKVHWYSRKSVDDGLTWTLLEDYQLAPSYDSGAMGAVLDGNNLIVAGYGLDSASTSHWLVRHYDGTSWTVLDDYIGPYGASTLTKAKAEAIYKSTDGTLYVLGGYTNSSGKRTWLVRRKLPSATTWDNVDEIQISPSTGTFAVDITGDSQGRIFATGYADEGTGLFKGYTRVYQNSAWQTIDVYKGGFSENTAHRIIPCLSDRVCMVGKFLDSYAQARGFIRFLSP